jgi:hypothetical protein
MRPGLWNSRQRLTISREVCNLTRFLAPGCFNADFASPNEGNKNGGGLSAKVTFSGHKKNHFFRSVNEQKKLYSKIASRGATDRSM